MTNYNQIDQIMHMILINVNYFKIIL